MSTLLIRNISQLVTCDDGDRVLQNADIYCEDGFIKSIGTALDVTADEVIDGRHMLCYPGLVNTHHHLYQVFSRNLPQVQNMELFDWLKTLYEIWKNLDEDVIRLSSLTGMGELMKHGCTTCFDHHYVFPAHSGDLLGAQLSAARELGIRLYMSRGSMDLSVKDGGLPPDSVVQTVDEIMADSVRCIEKYHDDSYGSMHRVALAPCSPFSVSAELLRQSAILARQYHVRLHTHLCETKDEENYMLEREGMRPLAFMQTLGWVGPDVWDAHGIHFNDEELKLLDIGLEKRMTQPVGLLSGGQRQALTLLMATMNPPKLLLLDEPAAGMNPQETVELTEFIREIREQFDLSILLIEHHMNLVMGISDRIYVLEFGKLIAEGIPEAVQMDQRVIDAYLGVDLDA